MDMTFAMVAGITGGILSLLAYVPRALKIIREGSHSRNIWLIWSLSNFLIFLSLYSLGVGNTIWVPLAYVIGSIFITVLTFTHQAGGWTTLHKWLLIISIISGLRWWFFPSPLITLGLNILIYVICYTRIIKVRLTSKKRETWVVTWALYFAGTILNVLAVTDWSLEKASYPVIILLMNAIVFSITLRNYIRNFKLTTETETQL